MGFPRIALIIITIITLTTLADAVVQKELCKSYRHQSNSLNMKYRKYISHFNGKMMIGNWNGNILNLKRYL